MSVSEKSSQLSRDPTINEPAVGQTVSGAQLKWEPPNGGLRAWQQVVGAFCLYFGTWGVLQSFGVFEAYYKLTLLPSYSTSEIAWIGSVQSFLLLFVGILSGPLFDKGYLLHLNALGAVLITLGLMTTSAATEYYQIFLAQGVAAGLGCGCTFAGSMAVVPAYFTTKRPLAMGIASLGSGIGGIIYPILFHRLQPHIGFPWTVRTMSFLTLFLLLVPLLLQRRPPLAPPPRRLPTHHHLADPVFALVTAVGLIGLIGVYVPFFEIQLFAQTKLNASADTTFYLIPIMNAGSTVGRLLASAAAMRLGPLNVYCGIVAFSGIICFTWIAVSSIPGCVAFSFFYGFASGAIFSLAPISIAYITADAAELGTRIGVSFGLAALGLLAGNPAAGALVDVQTGSFWKAAVFAGALMLGATGFSVAANVTYEVRRKREKRQRVEN